jgi:hypothetical protein
LFSSRLAFLPALAAFLLPTCVEAAAGPPVPLHERIDRLLNAGKDFASRAAGPASDSEFVRRIHLDLVGCIPTANEVRAFLADRSPTKRQALIDRLLASPEHARHLALVFDVMLMERRGDRFVPQPVWHEFLRSSFTANKPWDVLSREILAGDDDPKARYRAKFFLERGGEPNLITRDISRLFLGMNLQCAQCHNHPRIDDYRQEHYYGVFAFVGRSSAVLDNKSRMMLLAEKADGETTFQSVFDPAKVTKTALPHAPGETGIADPPLDKAKAYVVAPAPGVASKPRYSRRAQLAAALTRADYLPFRRNIANRLWALLMGRGLVMPLDMDHSNNPPSHPELLDLLADDIATRHFDIRGFLREIALSQAYQRSSEPPSGDPEKDGPLYSTAILKPLTPEQLVFSLMQATGQTETIRMGLGKGASEAAVYARVSVQVPAFVRTFSSPAGTTETFDARLEQALFLANGPFLRAWLASGPGSLTARLQKLSGDALADELYLSIFSRLPDTDERREVADFLTRRPGAFADLAWGLLTSTEFRFNH